MQAFGAGVVAGLGIAVPVGPISVLIVDLGMRRGLRPALAAGLGAATADLFYATVAAVAGLAAGRLLRPMARPLQVVAALVLAGIAAYRTWVLFSTPRGLPAEAVAGVEEPATRLVGTYTAFLGLTVLNPLTIVYFGALILGLPAAAAGGSGSRALFVAGAFLASACWQTILATGGGLLHHRLPTRARLVSGLAGNLIVLMLAVRLLLTA